MIWVVLNSITNSIIILINNILRVKMAIEWHTFNLEKYLKLSLIIIKPTVVGV